MQIFGKKDANIEAPFSLYPARKYCDITGLEAKYVDPATQLRYHSSAVYKYVIQATKSADTGNLSDHKIKEYLSLRKAAVDIK